MPPFNFEDINSHADAAKAMGCQLSLIKSILEYPSTFYTSFSIPRKRRDESRIVCKVSDNLKSIHKLIFLAITEKVVFPEYVQGFVCKRSIFTNASMHLAQKYVLNLDIKNFFESIKVEQVSGIFKNLGCNDEIALLFAHLCTFNERLVQGASTSPIIANLVCEELDKELLKIGKEYGCSYSRYADDITFSGEKTPKKKAISKCLERYGFSLHPDKWTCQPRGKSQYVTGLTVFDEVQPRLPKRMKRQLRQELHYANKFGLESHFQKIGIKNVDDMGIQIYRINGLIAFMYSVEPAYAYQFDVVWQEILKRENLEDLTRTPSQLLERHLAKKA
jgi:RNA-directed DNA polymerase